MPKKYYKKAKKSVDKKQSKAIRTIQRMIKPEMKIYVNRSQANGLTIESTNAVVGNPISNMSAGTNGSERIGDKVYVKSIEFNLFAHSANLAFPKTNFLRVMIVHDRRFLTSNALTGGQLLNQYALTTGSYVNALSTPQNDMINTTIAGRGKSVDLIYDKTLYFGQLSTGAGVSVAYGTIQHIKFKKTFKIAKQVNFEGTTASTGQFYVFIFPGESTTASDNPWYVWESYAHFYDT